MIAINLSSFTANGTSPKYDPAYPTGNRGAASSPVLVAAANFTNNQLVPATIYNDQTWFQYSDGRPGAAVVIENNAIKFTYPVVNDGGSGLGVWLSSLNTKEIYVTFRAKMPNAKNGIKFFKVFGKNITGGSNEVANCTFGLDYTGISTGKGSLYYLAYGDGTGMTNDTQNGIFLEGYTGAVGRSMGVTANVYTIGRNFAAADWGTGWHDFRFHVKFNDGTSAGNEVANGAFSVEIDGVLYANATGLFNRHWSNGDIDYVEFAGWTQGNGPAMDLYYDDIKVSVNGWPEAVQTTAFTPTAAFNFNGLTNAAPINISTPVYVSSRQGYGAFGNTAITQNGHSSSLQLKIRAGSDGLGNGTEESDGMFGMQYWPAVKAPKGQNFRFGFWIFIPTGFSYATNVDGLKFIRISQNESSQRLDVKQNTGQGTGGESASVGWYAADEEQTNGPQDVLYQVGSALRTNAWNYVETRLKPSDNPNTFELQQWCNDRLVMSIIGKNYTLYNSTGAVASTGSSGMYNLKTPAGLTETIWFCTYWNGGAPQDQSVYIDSCVYYSTSGTETLPAVDSYGNPMIGSVASKLVTA